MREFENNVGIRGLEKDPVTEERRPRGLEGPIEPARHPMPEGVMELGDQKSQKGEKGQKNMNANDVMRQVLREAGLPPVLPKPLPESSKKKKK